MAATPTTKIEELATTGDLTTTNEMVTQIAGRQNVVEAALVAHTANAGAHHAPYVGTPTEPPPDPEPTTGALWMSTQPDRSNPKLLAGVPQISGSVYIWYEPLEPVNTVAFSVNGVEQRVESAAPYDFGGTLGTARAVPFDTKLWTNDDITITTDAAQTDGGRELQSVTLAIFNTADIPTPAPNAILVPTTAPGGWLDQFPGPDRVFALAGVYEQFVGGQPRFGDTIIGDVLVDENTAAPYEVSEDGTALRSYKKSSGTAKFIRPEGAVGPVFEGASGVREIGGFEYVGYYPGGRGGNAASQKGALGGGGGFPGAVVRDIIGRDGAEGYGVRVAPGMILHHFILDDNWSNGFGGAIGAGTHIHHGQMKRNGKHGGGQWEAGNKIVFGPNDGEATAVIEYLLAEANSMAGVWGDIHVRNIIYRYIWAVRNGQVGIKHEVSRNALITQNVCQFNGQPSVPGAVPLGWGWPAGIHVQNSGSHDGTPHPIHVTKNIVDFGFVNEPWTANNETRPNVHQNGIATIQQYRHEYGVYLSDNITIDLNEVTRHGGNGQHIGRWQDNGPDPSNYVVSANEKISL